MPDRSPASHPDPALHPVRDHADELARAEAAVAGFAATRRDRWYPRFHIASDGGWINDPNGLCFHAGRWHVFYQLHPYATHWGPMHWGHVSSADMLTWRREPIMFAPSLEEERGGVYSGCAVHGDDGTLRFYYTGSQWLNGRDGSDGELQVQLLAEADDDGLASATKRGVVVDCPSEGVRSNFRDPKVFALHGTWYMTLGVTSAEGRGQMWLYASDDMLHWTFARVLFEHPDPNVYMLECPDLFPVRDAAGRELWVIGFSAMGARPHGFTNRNVQNAGYMVGTWEPGGAFEPLDPQGGFRAWDRGHNFYAPQSFTAPDGRQLMLGWMSPFVPPVPMDRDGWCGNLTLPREVTLGDDGDLVTAPAAELTGLREDTVDFGDVALGVNAERTLADDAEAAEIELTIDLTATTAERAGLRVHATDDGAYTAIAYDAQIGAVTVDRGAAAQGDRGYRAAVLTDAELAAGTLALRVFVDRGCVEVYVNGGRHVLSSISYPSDGPRAVRLVAESGTLRATDVRLHRLRGIGLE